TEVNLFGVEDSLYWKLSGSGVFSVKSMYTDLINTGNIPRTVHIWKVKVPLKIKVFTWFVHKGVILTKDNLAKRNWEGSKRCCFCDHDETIEYLFIKC
uniref:Reverse transcriptase zinc-binding domain-containing protein n=1 Tax=Aegilops tauschii subsp. strangulata TaxID=200361 RepID=A0A453G4S4_AEGTS